MEVFDRITGSEVERHLARLAGMKISRVWLGHADALFLECGRLRAETVRTSKRVVRPVHGQVTFMLECCWRVEKARSLDFGIFSRRGIIDERHRGLKGRRIAGVEATGRIPELRIELDDGRAVSTFTAHRKEPGWSIGFKDLRRIEVDEVWKGNDVSVWLSFAGGRFRRGYCFDERDFSDKAYLRRVYGVQL